MHRKKGPTRAKKRGKEGKERVGETSRAHRTKTQKDKSSGKWFPEGVYKGGSERAGREKGACNSQCENSRAPKKGKGDGGKTQFVTLHKARNT